jgi:VWFA-related protein
MRHEEGQMRTNGRRAGLAVIGGLLLTITLPGQGRPPVPAASQKLPSMALTTDVSVVQVDAFIVGGNGQFVTDLTRDEVEVLEDGKPQVLAGFELVSLPPPAAVAPLAARPLDVRSNTGAFEGRLYIILLDDLHIGPPRTTAARKLAKLFIERNLTGNDLAVVLTTSGSLAGARGFTPDRARLLRAVDGCVGSKVTSPALAELSMNGTPESISSTSASLQRVANARSALETMANLATYAGSVRQRRKALVLVSEGIDYDLSLRDNEASELRQRFFDFIGAANRSNLTVYSFDPRVFSHGGDEFVDVASTPTRNVENDEEVIKTTLLQNDTEFAQDNLRTLSSETGGFAHLGSREFDPAFERIEQEHSRYYMIGYYPSNDARDGSFRKISLRVSRPGVSVRARRGYTAAKADALRAMATGDGKAAIASTEGTEGTAAVVEGVSPAVEKALASALPVPGLTMRATAAAFRGGAGKASVVVLVQASGRDMLFMPRGDRFEDTLELAVVAIDGRGRTRGGTHVSALMPLSSRMQSVVAQTGVVFQLRLDLEPGAYQLRIAGQDAGSGVAGSVHVDLDVPDFAAQAVSLSGVVLSGERAGQVPSPRVDATLAKWLPGTPVTQREFQRADTITAVSELYLNKAEKTGRLTLATRVLDAGGRPVFQQDAPFGGSGEKGSVAHAHVVSIPLAEFVPGLYTLRVDASAPGASVPAARRDVVFSVR